MQAETLITIAGLCGLHHGVDAANHGLAVAPGVVAGQQVTAQAVTHKRLRGHEHLGFRPAKAVNALLGVAHNEHARCLACAYIATEPGVQRLPLQRVGVLELVNHQVLDAGVQTLLHPARQHRVAQHAERRTFHIVHVDPAALSFEGSKQRDQLPRQPGHALLVSPGIMLLACRLHAQHQVLRVSHRVNADNFFAKLAGSAGAGQQRRPQAIHIGVSHRLLKCHAAGRKGFGAGAGQRFGGGEQQRRAGRHAESVFGAGQAVELRKLRAERRDGRVHHASRVSQRKLGAFVQRSAQCLVGLEPAMRLNHRFIVAFKTGIGQQRVEKPLPHQRFGGCVVFEQRVIDRQFQLLEHRNRAAFQQRRKPAVKGAHLHRPARAQHRTV